ncbi:LmeA family phospholipid-binding protein, partial [Corynebacterium tuberculostearicum]|uniref:LmeA family phospholipid-binding protein n=2 Tax=Corynebacterium TaxID=1716 RepID=UPI002025E13A
MASKKSAGSLAWKIIIGILVALLVLILLAEFGLRWFIGHQMTSQFNEAAEQEGIQVKEDPSVSFGGSPLLLGLFKGSISQMDMTTPSTLQIDGTEIKGQPASEIHVEDMSTDQDNPVAGKLRASTTVPDDYLLASFQKGISEQAGSDKVGNMVVTEITANEQDHVLDVKFAGGLANLSLEPTAHDGKLDIRATEASIFGLELPDQATEAISSALQNGMSDQFVG